MLLASISFDSLQSLLTEQVRVPGDRPQPGQCIVSAEPQPILGARGEHAIRLRNSLEDEVVDQHPEIGVRSLERQRRHVKRVRGCVGACEQPLRRSLLVSGRAVDLASVKQAGKGTMRKPMVEKPRIGIFILDRVAGDANLDPLKALDRPQQRDLDIGWERGRQAVRVNRRIVETFGFEKDLMPVAVAEAVDLVLDRGAIARSAPGDIATEHWRTRQTRADDVMRSRIGSRDRAGELGQSFAALERRQPPLPRITRLGLAPRPIDCAAVKPSRRSGLQPAFGKTKFAETSAETVRRPIAGSAALPSFLATE